MPKLMCVFAFLGLAVFSEVSAAGESNGPSVSEKRIDSYEIQSDSLEVAIGKLSESSGVPVCLEISGPRLPEQNQPRITLSLRDATLGEVLDALCGQENHYTWREDGATGIMNIIPKDVVDDPNYVLNRTLKDFSVEMATIGEILRNVRTELGLQSSQLAFFRVGNLRKEPERLSFSVNDATVRQIINKIVSHRGKCYWIYGGPGDFRSVGIRRWDDKNIRYW